MKVLIVEDETAASENLAVMLNELDPGIEIVGASESVQQTVRLLRSGICPDLIFMDIQLSDGNSFAIFEQMEIDTPIIFTTAYDQFAIKAFKVNSIDYLLKPIKVSDLKTALNKFSRLSGSSRESYIRMMKQLPGSGESPYKTRIILTHKEDIIPVDTEEIAFFHTADRITSVFLKNGKRLPCSITLEQSMSQLDPEKFIRANKQFIISRDAIVKVSVRFDSRLHITTSVEAPETIFVSKNKAAEFKSWMAR